VRQAPGRNATYRNGVRVHVVGDSCG